MQTNIESKLNVQWHTVMIDAPKCSPDMAEPFRAVQRMIPNDAVYEEHPYQTDFPDGREQKPHTTVLFGLEEDQDLEAIRKHCADLPPVKFKIGNISAFRNEDKPYDVLKAEVLSEDMMALHYWIRGNFKNKCEFPFAGHITLAYIKKGTCQDLEGPCDWTGTKYTCDTLTFSHRDGMFLDIPMGTKVVTAATKKDADTLIKKIKTVAPEWMQIKLVGGLLTKEEAKDVDLLITIDMSQVPDELYESEERIHHPFLERIDMHLISEGDSPHGYVEEWNWKGNVVDIFVEYKEDHLLPSVNKLDTLEAIQSGVDLVDYLQDNVDKESVWTGIRTTLTCYGNLKLSQSQKESSSTITTELSPTLENFVILDQSEMSKALHQFFLKNPQLTHLKTPLGQVILSNDLAYVEQIQSIPKMGPEGQRQYHVRLKFQKGFSDDGIRLEFVATEYADISTTLFLEFVKVGPRKGFYHKEEASMSLAAKQVGPLYHITTFWGAAKILNENQMKSSYSYISFTRDKNWYGWNDSHTVRLTLDGDQLSQNSKIEPYHFGSRSIDRSKNSGESEERIQKNPLTNVVPAIKKIEIFSVGELHGYAGAYKTLKDYYDTLKKAADTKHIPLEWTATLPLEPEAIEEHIPYQTVTLGASSEDVNESLPARFARAVLNWEYGTLPETEITQVYDMTLFRGVRTDTIDFDKEQYEHPEWQMWATTKSVAGMFADPGGYILKLPSYTGPVVDMDKVADKVKSMLTENPEEYQGLHYSPWEALNVIYAEEKGSYILPPNTYEMLEELAHQLTVQVEATAADESLEKSQVAYHVTPKRNLPRIKREGIKPKLGPRSKTYGESTAAIFLYPTLIDVEDGLANWLGDELEDMEIVVLELDITGLAQKREAFEIQVTEPIQADRIKRVLREEGSGWATLASSKKTEAKKIFDSSEQTPYLEVLRIENSEGKGPYRHIEQKTMETPEGVVYHTPVWTEKPHVQEFGKPNPENDPGFTYQDVKEFNQNRRSILFGFKDMQQLNNWVSKKELEELKKLGFSIVKRKAAEAWDSGLQVFFIPIEAVE